MQTFFHGWRRKAGWVLFAICLTLVVEAVRSLVVTDLISLRTGPNTSYQLASERSGLIWIRTTKADGVIEVNEIQLGQDLSLQELLSGFQMIWQFELCGMRMGAGTEYDPMASAEIRDLLKPPTFVGSRAQVIIIPHWLVALPLFLLSACLFLVPSRKRPTENQPHA